MMERRSAGGAVRKVSQGLFDALAVRYGVVDDYQSVFAPGCFTENLNKRLPVICFGHDHTDPIGRATRWADTADGPLITAQLDVNPDVPRARQVRAQLESGTLTDVSVGFYKAKRRDPTDDERKKWPGVREVITKADLMELSVVTIGAVPGAVVTSARSVELARALAEGRISPTTYRAELAREHRTDFDLDDQIDRAVGRVRSIVRGSARTYDPVAKWTGIVEAKEARKEADRKREQERKDAERRRDQKIADRYNADPWAAFH